MKRFNKKRPEDREAKRIADEQLMIGHLASKLTNQGQLDYLLLKVKNRTLRREIFETYKPYIVNFKPVFRGLVASYHEREKYDPISKP